jgi:hypothetical protein
MALLLSGIRARAHMLILDEPSNLRRLTEMLRAMIEIYGYHDTAGTKNQAISDYKNECVEFMSEVFISNAKDECCQRDMYRYVSNIPSRIFTSYFVKDVMGVCL